MCILKQSTLIVSRLMQVYIYLSKVGVQVLSIFKDLINSRRSRHGLVLGDIGAAIS